MKFVSILVLWLLTQLQVQNANMSLTDSTMIPSKCPTLNVTNGRVRLRSKGRVARVKCKPTYTIIGAKVLTCIRNTWDFPPPICTKRNCPPLPEPKNGHWVTYYKGAVYTLLCDAGYLLSGPRTIFCLDTQWNDTIPSCQESDSGPLLSCDFEREDLCGWTQDNYSFNWSRQSHNTPSGHIGTGPSFDHTLGSGRDGHYLYIESSSRLENDTARLLSPVFGPELSQNACFIFWYHMFGATTGTLKVNLRLLSDDGANTTTIFSKSGEQGDRWYGSLTQLTPVDQPFQIVIEGIRGRSYASDIAIDDVKLASGEDCELVTVAPTEFFIQTTLVTSSPSVAESATVAQRTPRPFPTYLPPPPPPPLPPLSPDLTVMTSPAAPYPYTPKVTIIPFYSTIYSTVEKQDEYVTTDASSPENYPETLNTETDESQISSVTMAEIVPAMTTIDTTPRLTTKPTISTTITTKKTTLKTTLSTTQPPTTKSTERITKIAITTKTTPFPSSSIPAPKTVAFVPLPATKQPWTRTTASIFISSVIKAPAPSPHTKGIVIISSAVIVVAVLAAVVIFIAARRRIKLKRRNDMAEDSDVRFLTSDEVLDFNLARPMEDDL